MDFRAGLASTTPQLALSSSSGPAGYTDKLIANMAAGTPQALFG